MAYIPLTSQAVLNRIDRSMGPRRSSWVPEELGSVTLDASDPFLSQTFSMDEDLQEAEEQPTLYLPPTLSRLPVGAQGAPHKQTASSGLPLSIKERRDDRRSFNFAKPTIGYTDSVLPSIDLASWHLHEALHKFRPASHDYAQLDYRDAFNWSEIRIPREIEAEWYIVAFRSQRNLLEDSGELYEADRAAHEEAVTQGGLLLYWYGVPNVQGLNLATCIWQSREAALAAMHQPKHRHAMMLASRMYKVYTLERWILRKRRGRRELDLLPWTEAAAQVRSQ